MVLKKTYNSLFPTIFNELCYDTLLVHFLIKSTRRLYKGNFTVPVKIKAGFIHESTDTNTSN